MIKPLEMVRSPEPQVSDFVVFYPKKLAGGPGFEPGLAESESAVLPLNYPPAIADGETARGGRARSAVRWRVFSDGRRACPALFPYEFLRSGAPVIARSSHHPPGAMLR